MYNQQWIFQITEYADTADRMVDNDLIDVDPIVLQCKIRSSVLLRRLKTGFLRYAFLKNKV